MACQRFQVKGLVQGVFFRASTQEKAQQLGLTGWVKNLPDGRVEVLANGKEEDLKEFYIWLQQGPPMANVSDVEMTEGTPDEIFRQFEVRYD